MKAETADKRKNRKIFLYAGMVFLLGVAGLGKYFSEGDISSGLLFLLLGAAAAGAVLYLPVQKEKERRKKRSRELTAQYAGMVTSLSLYMTAGLSLRSSWERIVREYRAERKDGGSEKAVYEEMDRCFKAVLGGEFEDRAYGAFGRRCGTPEYLKLGSLLETYVRQGNRELFRALEQEAANALTVELQRVKRRGERAATLLLIPIILLFGLTLLMVIVPAFMQLKVTF